MTVSSTSSATANVSAARNLPAKSWPRLCERVRIVFQVPNRSSLEKMSPATTAVSTGPTQAAPKPSTTIGIAKPELCTHWPNAVSPGVALCTCSTATARNGPMTASAAIVRTWIRRLSLSSSSR